MDTVKFKFLDKSLAKEPVQLDETVDLPQFTLADTEEIDCSTNYSTGEYLVPTADCRGLEELWLRSVRIV